MNTHSLKFRLIAWYAGVLLGFFVVLGVATYLVLENYLVEALKQTQVRRGRQIAQLLVEESRRKGLARVGEDIETRYAPGLNERFVRITRSDGEALYTSSLPKSQTFVPAALPPPPAWPIRSDAVDKVPLLEGRKLLLTSQGLEVPGGARYVIETGALMDDLQQVLRRWLMFLVLGLPVAVLLAGGGGYLLVNRALSPVDQIATSAERISSHDLSARLPVPHTGDELERLSVALNHMIERLDGAFRYSRRFIEDASHELRTPLTVLRGEIETFAQEPRLGPEWRERLGSALEEVERLVNIVEGLFAISRLDAGEAQAEAVKFDLGQLVASTADQMSLLAEDKGITVNCAPAEKVWVDGDRARMKQIVVNLLDNAIKYTPQGGTIHLNVEARENKAVLEVADNGIGIPPEALPRVFERFYRVDKARSRDRGGAGLGLSIVKSICAAHQGRVEASSVQGKGSIFRVEMPLAANSTNNGNHIK
jgi:heavy metal sensor kinase